MMEPKHCGCQRGVTLPISDRYSEIHPAGLVAPMVGSPNVTMCVTDRSLSCTHNARSSWLPFLENGLELLKNKAYPLRLYRAVSTPLDPPPDPSPDPAASHEPRYSIVRPDLALDTAQCTLRRSAISVVRVRPEVSCLLTLRHRPSGLSSNLHTMEPLIAYESYRYVA